MKGQLYKISGGDPVPDGHDPAGDLVYSGNHDDELIGFVLRRLPGDVFLIVLMEPRELPPGAEVVLEACDAIKTMQEEVLTNPAFKAKITKLLTKITKLLDP